MRRNVHDLDPQTWTLLSLLAVLVLMAVQVGRAEVPVRRALPAQAAALVAPIQEAPVNGAPTRDVRPDALHD